MIRRIPVVAATFVACLASLLPSAPAAAGDNYALLVAVGDYDPKQLHKLPFSRNDILDFHQALLASGFRKENLVLMHDDPKAPLPSRVQPEAAKIRKQLTLLLAGRDEDDTVILAFAGHGVQFKGDASSYFCPLDADLDQKETLIPLKEVYDAMKACPAQRKLLLVDACRNDPRTAVSRSRKTVDLESITRPQKQPVPESVVAFFSCAAGQQSFESPDLKHGVFFHQVLEVWKNGTGEDAELTLDDLVYHTRKRTEAFVRTTLEAVQTPELQGSPGGRWVLRTYDKGSAKPGTAVVTPGKPTPKNTAPRIEPPGSSTVAILDLSRIKPGDLPKDWKGTGLAGLDLSFGYPALAVTATPKPGTATKHTVRTPPVDLPGDYFVEFELVCERKDTFLVRLIEDDNRLGPELRLDFGRDVNVSLGENQKQFAYEYGEPVWCRLERRDGDYRFSVNGGDRTTVVLRRDETPRLRGLELDLGGVSSSVMLRSLRYGPLQQTAPVGETRLVVPDLKSVKKGELPAGWSQLGVLGPKEQREIVSDPLDIVGDFFLETDVVYTSYAAFELTLLGKDDWPSLPIRVSTARRLTMRVGPAQAETDYDFNKPHRLRLERAAGKFTFTLDGRRESAVTVPAEGYGSFRGVRIDLRSPPHTFAVLPPSIGPLKGPAGK